MAGKLTKKQKEALTDKISGLIRNGPALRMTLDSSVNEMNINQISGELNRIHDRAIGKEFPAVITITPKQEGSGDPAPSNIRPISGYEIDGIGTVYGGELNIDTGVLTVNGSLRVLNGSEDFWSSTSVAGDVRRFYTVTSYRGIDLLACDSLKINLDPYTTNNIYVSGNRLTVTPDWAQSITTIVDFKAALALHPVTLVQTTTPETYTLTPQQMLQLLDQL